MPQKNTTKAYVEDGYYHIYNRGVEKRTIFLDDQDYGVFLSYLKEYLVLKDEKALRKRMADEKTPYKERGKIAKLLRLNNFSQEVTLLAYCLMPNHFHLFVKQRNPGAIDSFMNSLGTRYTMYFNRKHSRVGPLYQDVYKAVLVTSEEQFVHLTGYIHRQALALHDQPSSYPEYCGARRTVWIHPEEVLSFFSKDSPLLSYENFVAMPENTIGLVGLTLD